MYDGRPMQPYRLAPPRPEPRFRVQGAELVLQDGAALRPVCLACGTKKDVAKHERKLTTAHGGAIGGSVGGVVGSGIARTMKEDVALAILGGAIAAAVIGGVLWFVFKPKPSQIVTAELPSCIVCDDKFRAAASATRRFAGFGLLALFGSLGIAALKIWLLAALVFAGSIALIILAGRQRKKQSQVHARLVENGEAFLVGVSPRALEVLAGLRPPRKSKKKKKPPAPLPPGTTEPTASFDA